MAGTVTDQGDELRRVLSTRDIHCRYQPIVELETREVVAYEALARGPRESQLAMPLALFDAAERAGLTAALDQLCRAAALEGAASVAAEQPIPLFVNVEPDALGSDLFDEQGRQLLDSGRVRVTVELTERALTSKPAELLAAVEWLRERGVGIALDDVGADERSIALMPLVAPDVVKLDLRLVQDQPSRRAAAIINAVWAEAERTEATILAEGLETEEHLQRAIALGARFGQGWLFGRPEEMPADPPLRGGMRTLRRPAAVVAGTPFETVSARRQTRPGTKQILLDRSLQLEEQAAALGPEGVLLSTFQDSRFLTPLTAARYERLGRDLAFVGVFGVNMPEDPIPCVRGGRLEATETLQDEWDVVVLGPHFAGAFCARDLGDFGEDSERRFDFCMTYERDLVIQAARSLMTRAVARG